MTGSIGDAWIAASRLSRGRIDGDDGSDGTGAATDARTIDDLLPLVPEGATRLFRHAIDDDAGQRFFSVHQNWDYEPGRLRWLNRATGAAKPWFGSRFKARTPVFSAPEPEFVFDGRRQEMVDFYSTGSDAFLLSEKLIDLIMKIDPASLECRSVVVNARDGAASYGFAMPSRNLTAVDARRTDVLVKDEDYAGQWIRAIEFPTGVRFLDETTAGVSNFSDRDASDWVWSRELIEAAKAAGIKGLYTRVPKANGPDIDRL